MSFEEEK